MTPNPPDGANAIVDLRIDEIPLLNQFGRDIHYHDKQEQNVWLDKEDGSILYIYVNDEDSIPNGVSESENRRSKRSVAQESSRYIRIPGLTHGECHLIHDEFLRWRNDPESIDQEGPIRDNDELRRARILQGNSIKRWKSESTDEEFEAYNDYRDQRVKRLAERYLRERGINPIWS